MTGQPNIFQTAYNWQKGVNNSVADEFIDDQELSDSANYQIDSDTGGNLIKREGITRTSSVISGTISSVYQGRNAKYFSAGTSIFDFTGSIVDNSGITASRPTWTSFATYDIIATGSELRKSSNGTSFAALTGFTAGIKYVASVNNYFYFAGHTKGQLGWATAGTLTFDAASALILTQDEADDIIALVPWRNALLVLLGKSHELISGFSQLEQGAAYYSKDEGCVATKSVVVTPVGVFWWSKAGITWLKNDYSLDCPSQRKISKTIAGLNRGQDANVHAVYDPTSRRVMFFLFNGGAQTTCNLRVDYYCDRDAFYFHTGAGAAMAASGMAIVSGVANVYCGGYTTTYLYKVYGVTDDTAAIDSYLESKREAYGGPSILKMSRKATITTGLTTQETITYGVYVDNDTTLDTNWANVTPTSGSDIIIGTNRQHRKIKHRISDSATTRTRILGLRHDGTVIRSI